MNYKNNKNQFKNNKNQRSVFACYKQSHIGATKSVVLYGKLIFCMGSGQTTLGSYVKIGTSAKRRVNQIAHYICTNNY